MISPCTRVCTINEATGICLGCGRSLAEIAAWATMTDAERSRVMDRLSGANASPHADRRSAV